LIVTKAVAYFLGLRNYITTHFSSTYGTTTFSSAGWAIHISRSKSCLCIWMLTTVAQIVSAAHGDL